MIRTGSFAGFACCLMLASICFGQASRPSLAVPDEGAFDPVPAMSAEPIPRDQLLKMDETELGKLFQTADADRLLKAHELIESYFAASRLAERKPIVAALEELHLPVGIIGRITRLRLHWPALQPGIYYVNQKRGPYTLRYFVGLPDGYDRSRAWPLVIKLASSSAFLTDPAPDAARVAKMYETWIKDDLSHHPDAVVLMPLLNFESFYGPSYVGMNSVIQPMIDLADRVNIDPARVYTMGHSAAASAAWNLALQYPTYFASFLPLAGVVPYDWQRLRLMNLRNTPP